ncbi:hypothetical protein NN561_018574 [Cricetulus griseus]
MLRRLSAFRHRSSSLGPATLRRLRSARRPARPTPYALRLLRSVAPSRGPRLRSVRGARGPGNRAGTTAPTGQSDVVQGTPGVVVHGRPYSLAPFPEISPSQHGRSSSVHRFRW